MTASYVLDLPLQRPPLTSNQARGAHWSVVRDARNTVAWHVRAQLKGIPPMDRCHVRITWYAKGRHTRDAGSLTPLEKAAIDALVDFKILPADDATHVLSESYSVRPGSDHAHITITLEPAEEAA